MNHKTPTPHTLFLCFLALAFTPWTPSATAIDLFKRKPKTPAFAPEPAPDEVDTIVRVQIYLDGQLFGPGKIDGSLGQFTRKAIAHYNTRRGIRPVHNWGPLLENAALAVPNTYTTYTLKEGDFKHIDKSVPAKYEDQKGLKYLPYRSTAEFLAERYHSSENFLKKINPTLSLWSLKAGSTVRVPNVTPFRIEDLPKNRTFSQDVALSSRHVIIDTRHKVAAIWDAGDGQLVASFPITPGKEKFIHRGDWTLKNMITTPEFRYDKSMLEEGVRSDEAFQIPPGPNNPVGVIWCGTSKSGIGLHGTSSPHSIGRSRSAGCIRFANWDAIRLPTLLRPGAKVTIR